MVLGDAEEMRSGMSILRNGRWDGFPETRGYRSGSVLDVHSNERYDLNEVLSVPARHPSMGRDHVLDDMLATVTSGERQGFGTLELNRH